MALNLFDLPTLEKFTESDWDSVTNEDNTLDTLNFLTLISKRINLPLSDEALFHKNVTIIRAVEQVLGAFTRQDAKTVALLFCLSK